MGYDELLFQDYALCKKLEAKCKDIANEISEYNENDLLNTDTDELIAYFEEKHRLTTPRIAKNNISSSVKDKDITVENGFGRVPCDSLGVVKGYCVTIHIPFEGDEFLFKCAPLTYSLNPPRGYVNGKTLEISCDCTDPETDPVSKQEVGSLIDNIEQWLGWIEEEIAKFNTDLPGYIRGKIESRKKTALAIQNNVEALGFPLRRREDAPTTHIVPLKKKKVVVKRPQPASSCSKPEAILAMAQYEEILSIISSMSRVMECSPSAFATMGEEHIRWHFLVQLNGQYEWQSTAETFNRNGKTDIMIRYQDRAIFIAECKFWAGKRVLLSTVDQLLSYLSWRDTKTAILIFNKNKEMSRVLKQIPDTVKQHPNYLEEMQYTNESGFRFKLHHNDDKNRNIILTVLVFDIPLIPKGQ